MRTILYSLAALASFAIHSPLVIPAYADQQAYRASLVGSWVQSGGTHAWIIDSNANGLHMTQIEGSGTVADFNCDTLGQKCDVKISGHKATVSMYYNGSSLVQLENKDGEIVQRKFTASGDSLKVEVTPMTGKLQTEDREFQRGQPAVAKK